LTNKAVIPHNSPWRKHNKLVKIRLRRIGAKKSPSYRLVVADARAPRDGAFITIIGHYNPLTDPETIVIDEEKARHWLSQGAQTTDTAARLLAKAGIIEEPKARIEKIKAGAPAKPKAKKKKAKAEGEATEEPKAEVTEEPEAKATEEPKAEVTEEPEAKAAEEPKAEVTEKSKTIKEEPEASITEEAKATKEEPKASKKKAKAGEKQTEPTKEQS
jgi:small subunit ribosomal protein S16